MIEAYITSSIEGRLRIRHPFIMDKGLADGISGFLKTQTMLDSFHVNPRSGSVLIEYDSEKTTQEEIIANLEEYAMSYCIENNYLEQLIKFEEKANAVSKSTGASFGDCCIALNLDKISWRRLISRAMVIFLVSSIGLGSTGKMSGHLLTSGIFTLLSVVHLYTYRKKV